MKKYVEGGLMPNEQVIEEGKVSYMVLLPHILLMFIFIGFFTIIKPLIVIFTTELAITDKKIMGKTGLIKTDEMSSPLSAIQNVKVQSGLFGKIFKYGTIHITTTSGTYSFAYIKNADQFKNTLFAQIENQKLNDMDENAARIAKAMKNA